LAAISQAHQLKSVILSFVYSLLFKSSKVIITQTNHTTYLATLGYFNLSPNPFVHAHGKENHPIPQLASTAQNKLNDSKATHDVTKLFTSQGEQPSCFKSTALPFFFLFFVYLFNFWCYWTTLDHAWADKQKLFGRVKKCIRCLRKQHK